MTHFYGIDHTYVLAGLALLFSLVSFEANRRFGKRARLKEIQKTVNDYQKELKQANERKDEKKVKELQARETEMLSLTQEMLVLPFRSMVVVIPLFFGALWFVNSLVSAYSLTLPFSLPVPDLSHFALNWRNTFGPRGSFILFSILFGLVIEFIVSRREKQRLAAAQGKVK